MILDIVIDLDACKVHVSRSTRDFPRAEILGREGCWMTAEEDRKFYPLMLAAMRKYDLECQAERAAAEVAKACMDCGQTGTAKAREGHLCHPCHNRLMASLRPRLDNPILTAVANERVRTKRRERSTFTRQYAIYHGRPWANEESEALLTHTGTDLEIALHLGRTINAVKAQRAKLRGSNA